MFKPGAILLYKYMLILFLGGGSYTYHLEQALTQSHIAHTRQKTPAEKANVICPCIK